MVGEGMVMGVVPVDVPMGGIIGRMGMIRMGLMGLMGLVTAANMVEVVVVRCGLDGISDRHGQCHRGAQASPHTESVGFHGPAKLMMPGRPVNPSHGLGVTAKIG